ncbi:MAG: helix-turn-helix transcriptional regulator [Verrucomicrobiales bacterium]|nr:helix-turn-helix transcriptional regulator [Verrucomicrobiales bacterium]MCP5556436.1 helix-turn-helix transcriptional regulator [Verrucomicrobiaceae bacterium]
MARQRNYLNYTTPWGVALGRVAKAGWSPFLIHESGYREDLDNWNHIGVDSPFWRFYHNPEPGCFLRFQGRKIPLEPSTAILIPSDTVFDCCGPICAAHFWLHFTTSRPGRPIEQAPIKIALDATLSALTGEVIATHQSPALPSRDELLYHQSAALLHTAFSRLDLPSPAALPEPLLEILSLIERAPHSDLSNPFLAARAAMSTERFIRWFKAHLQQTPAAHVQAVRLRLAGEALALTDKSIEEIAVECGFPNRHYLSRLFSQKYGSGPAEYRLRQGKRRGK